jgi:hypothetical protein
MTITRLGIIRGSRRGIITNGDILKREFVETHVLTSDDGTDDEGDVFAVMVADGYDTGDPWTGANGSTNPGVTVQNHVISDHNATLRRWEVEVQYSSELPDGGQNQNQGTDPTDWSPEVRWETTMEERVADRDIQGQQVLLPNKEVPQYPPVYKKFPIHRLTYSRWVDSYSSSLNLFYSAKTNSDVFLGYPVNTAFMEGISAEAEFLFGQQRWRITYNILFDLSEVEESPNNPTWWGHLGRSHQVGTFYIDPVTGKKAAQKFDEGPTIKLDAAGNKTTQDYMKRWQLYKSVPFTPII